MSILMWLISILKLSRIQLSIIIIIIIIIFIIIIINTVIIIVEISPGPALVSSKTDQGALEQATGRVLRLRIKGPCTEGYC